MGQKYIIKRANMKPFLSKIKSLSYSFLALSISILPEPPPCPEAQGPSWACAETDDIAKIIEYIIKELITPLAGGVAMIFLIWGSIQYLTAYGNEEKAKRAKTTIIWAIVGIVVIILSRFIVDQVNSLFQNSP